MTVGIDINGHTVILDEEDLPLLRGYSWRIHPSEKSVMSFIYLGPGKSKAVKLHRLILGLGAHKPLVDHKNRNPLDNRKCNLRLVTNAQNSWNRGSSIGMSKYIGVIFLKKKKRNKPKNQADERYISARILVDKKQKFLGVFKTEKEAAIAYNEAAVKYRGEFANLNIIE